MIEPTRPDPDALLEQVQADEAKAQLGKLKIFFGANAGVGKTYAMLAAARAAQAQGRAVLVGVVETHGRSETEAMARDLPRLPLKEIPYRGQLLKEFDLDGALAFEQQHPEGVVLVDELAHSNAPGSRHPKRWQDVQELLAGGVDVWTTLNVQHLESLNDIVGGITGIRVQETLPDRVFDEADEVVLVDIPPDELLTRLKQGKVYLAAQAERAAKHFFRKGNLLALRELALRRTADRVDDEMLAYRRSRAVDAVWPNRESLLACIGPGAHGEKVVRSCARLAAQLEVSWHAVHVQRSGARRSEAEQAQVLRVLKLAEELGAQTAQLSDPSTADALLRYARAHNLSRLVLGRREGGYWRWPGQRSLAEQLSRRADDVDVLQVALPAQVQAPARDEAAKAAETLPIAWGGYLAAFGVCALVTLIAAPLSRFIEQTNIVMLYLVAVLGVALWLGRGPAVLAAFVGVGAFDFFFVEPKLSFAVSDVQYLLTFAAMLAVALVIGQLTAGLKAQAQAAAAGERRMRALYEMAGELGSALLPEQVAEIGARFLRAEFGGARSALWALDLRDRLQPLPGGDVQADEGLLRWAFDKAQSAGWGTDTLPSSPCLVLPLKAAMRVRGALALQPVDPARQLGPEERQLLETCATLLANALERQHYNEVAQASSLQIESERLRNALLSAISHDLRTPLAALVGLADTLQLRSQAEPGERDKLVAAIRQSATRMATLVGNLLDMARLQAGAVQLNRQWLPLEEVIGSARAELGPAISGWPLTVRLHPELPPLLLLDAVLFERVLVNLLENAAKYTPRGTSILLSAAPEGEQWVQIAVEDRGPGLPARLRGADGRWDLLFDKFQRGEREGSTPGVGLGLALCKAIVEAHGGTIAAETPPAGGARFVIRLPRGNPPATEAEGV